MSATGTLHTHLSTAVVVTSSKNSTFSLPAISSHDLDIGQLSFQSLLARYIKYQPVWLGLSTVFKCVHLCRVAGDTV